MSRPAQGFTLIEVLVAVAMLSVIAVATSGFLLTILKSNTRTQSSQSLSYVAQDYMERVKLDWAACDKATGTTTCSTPITYSRYDNASLLTVPTTLPSGVTCTSTASPSTTSSVASPVRSREVTLSCVATGSAPTQKYSLIVTQP